MTTPEDLSDELEPWEVVFSDGDTSVRYVSSKGWSHFYPNPAPESWKNPSWKLVRKLVPESTEWTSWPPEDPLPNDSHVTHRAVWNGEGYLVSMEVLTDELEPDPNQELVVAMAEAICAVECGPEAWDGVDQDSYLQVARAALLAHESYLAEHK